MNTKRLNKSRKATFYFQLMHLIKEHGFQDILLMLRYLETHISDDKLIKQAPLYYYPPIKKRNYWIWFSPNILFPNNKMTNIDVFQFTIDNGLGALLWILKSKNLSIWQKMREMSQKHNNLSIEMLQYQSELNETRNYKPHQVQNKFYRLKPELDLLKKLIKKNQKEYIRRRLRAILMLWTGSSRQEVEEKLDINPSTLINWLKVMVEYGVKRGLQILASPKQCIKYGKLQPRHQYTLLYILNHYSPHDFGYFQNIFTARILIEIVKKLWNIEVSDETIYNFLHKHDLSYQRGHNDYEDPCPIEQRAYVEELYQTLKSEETGVKKVFFDECSVTNCGTIFYGWAKKNTRVRVYTRQRKKKRLNCFVSVDAVTGEEYIDFHKKSTFVQVSDYFYDLILKTYHQGYHKMIIILDNHTTHKDKMRYRLWLKVKANPLLSDFEIEYLDTPRYSPDFNLAEYIIHQLRLKLLHHLPSNMTIQQIQDKIWDFIADSQFQTPQQIKNTINHIFALGSLTSRI